MNQTFPFQDAKAIVRSVCDAAKAGEFETREAFMDMLTQNPHLAVQGYNAFGKIFFWNNASCHLYGHSESAAVNQDLFDLVMPHEMRQMARAQILMASKTGIMPEACACDLLRHDGDFVTVYSGHLQFQWDGEGRREFYCVDLAMKTEAAEIVATAP